MSHIRAGLALTAAFAFTLTVAGCGSSDNNTASVTPSSAAPAIAKADFLTQGNAICAKGNTEIAAIGQNIDTTDAAAVNKALTDQVLPNISDQITQLKALGYPDGDQATLDGIYSAADTLITGLESDPSPMLGGADPFNDINSQLTTYGLTQCGSSGS